MTAPKYVRLQRSIEVLPITENITDQEIVPSTETSTS
jgi:hypothetical protein